MNPGYQSQNQPILGQFVDPNAPSAPTYQDPATVPGHHMQPVVVGNQLPVTSQVYPQATIPQQNPQMGMMKPQVVYDRPQAMYTNVGSPLLKNPHVQDVPQGNFYNPGDNNTMKNLTFLCCGCGIIVILVSSVLGTLVGAVSGGAGCIVYLLVPVGMCMMCVGCFTCLAIDPNKEYINQM